MPLSLLRTYALRLLSPPGDAGRLAGRIEHVPSGRLHRFDDAQALIDWLIQEQAHPAADPAADAGSGAAER